MTDTHELHARHAAARDRWEAAVAAVSADPLDRTARDELHAALAELQSATRARERATGHVTASPGAAASEVLRRQIREDLQELRLPGNSRKNMKAAADRLLLALQELAEERMTA